MSGASGAYHADSDPAALLEAARQGSERALAELLRRCQPDLLVMANQEIAPDLQNSVGPAETVEQTLQEAQRSFRDFTGATQQELLAWLRGILCQNVATTWRQHRATEQRRADLDMSVDEVPAEAYSDVPRPDAVVPAGGHASQPERFTIIRELGRGGFGIVSLAFDTLLKREVAIKTWRLEMCEEDASRQRFVREGQSAAAVDHPNLVRILDAHDDGRTCFLVMAYCRGPSLRTWLKERATRMPVGTVAWLVATLADAVHHIHMRGILHRDVKPANILLEPTAPTLPEQELFPFTPLLTDFGLAKPVEGDSQQLTQSGVVQGTPAYMAPEQADPRRGMAGPALDVYALGVLLYELLTGEPPFRGGTPVETVRLLLDEEPIAPRRLRPGLPRDLETICLMCLRKEPQQRYASASALAEDLNCWRQDLPIRGRRASRIGRLWRWGRRNRALAITAGVSLCLLSLQVGTLILRPGPASGIAMDSLSADEKRYAEYLEQTAPLLERLKRGEEVELIAPPADGRRQVAFYPHDAFVKGVTNEQGLRVDGTGFANFLELLPRVPSTHYRITARVLLESAQSERCSWGIYTSCDREPTSCGLQVYYRGLVISEDKFLVQSLRTGDKEWEYHAFLGPHLFANLVSPAKQVVRDDTQTVPNAQQLLRRKPRALPNLQARRTVVIDVTPSALSASCTDNDATGEVGPYELKHEGKFLKHLRTTYRDLEEVPTFPRANSALGIFLQGSTCTVESVKIQALPTP